jgi:hypothetical protein
METMLSRLAWGSLALLWLSPSVLFAQVGGFLLPDALPDTPATRKALDARQQRWERERAVALAGPIARDFVETYGQDAVSAISACRQPVALKLAEFHASGDLGRLPRPRDLLRVISRPEHGSDVVLWAIAHVDELTDRDNFDAYLLDPLSYAMAIKNLEQGAAEVRLGKDVATNRRVWSPEAVLGCRIVALGGGVTAIFALLIWRGRQRYA